jgi:hypothetical protein
MKPEIFTNLSMNKDKENFQQGIQHNLTSYKKQQCHYICGDLLQLLELFRKYIYMSSI